MFVEERWLRTTVVIKRVAALFLLVAFFLPLSQCTVEVPTSETRAIERQVIVTYAYSRDKWPSVDALAIYVTFLWPLLFAVASLISPSVSGKLAIGIVEILLCVGSGFMLFTLTYIGMLKYGAYVAMGSIGVYFIATSVQLVARMRKRWGQQT